MKRMLGAAALAVVVAGLPAASLAQTAEQDGPFMVRLRAVYLDFAQKSDAIPALGVPSDAITVNKKWIPDLDLEYFFTKNVSAELVLTYPQSQTVTIQQSALGGPVDIGTFKHLPPTITAKWNFIPDGVFRPYVGLGVNLTFISDVSLDRVAALNAITGNIKLDSTSIGPAAQAGFDVKFADHWFGNVDVKYIKLKSDVKTDNFGKVSTAHLDPWLLGIGIGYRFGAAAPAPMPAPKPAPAPAPKPAPAPAAAPPAPPPPPPPPAPKPATPPPAPPAQEVILKGVNFETASAKLKPESSKVLDEVAANIKKCGCGQVEIRGYTDSVGKPAYNQKLSERRAEAVKAYLVAHGVSAGTLTAQGLGEENPIASNATAAGRAENRRVTVQFKGLAAH